MARKDAIDAWLNYWDVRADQTPRPNRISIKILNDLLKQTHDYELKRVLEVGSGSGLISAFLAKQGFEVTLLDISPIAIDIAKKQFSQMQVSGSFVVSDLFRMPFEPESFDLVWNAGVLEHFVGEDRLAALRAMANMTKKGGLVITYNPFAKAVFYRLGKWMGEKRRKWEFGPEYPVMTLGNATSVARLDLLCEYPICAKEQLVFIDKYILRGASRFIRAGLGWMPENLWLWLFGGYLLCSVFRK
jgi:SAM-dependent methyltransferase